MTERKADNHYKKLDKKYQIPCHNLSLTFNGSLPSTVSSSSHFTQKQWEENNSIKFQTSETQEKLADKIIAESEHVIENARSITEDWKKEVDYRLTERSAEIKFLIDEIRKQKTLACLEIEKLIEYRERISYAIINLHDILQPITEKCISCREHRQDDDLVDDEVNGHLRLEMKVLQNSLESLHKILNETNEQIRRIRANIYSLDKDVENKEKSYRIDQTNLNLNENQLEFPASEDGEDGEKGKKFHKCILSKVEWEETTNKNILASAKEIQSATQIRSYTDILLKQIAENLSNQFARTNETFSCRISETRYAKSILEAIHNQTSNQINEVERNLIKLEKELNDKVGYVKLCRTRLGNRTQRPRVELVCDEVHDTLLKEYWNLEDTIQKLKSMIDETRKTERYLLHTKKQQENELNVKINTLKIDEIDCMTARNGLEVPEF